MKPITDDVVFSIMKGLEKREKRQKAELAKVSLPDKILGTVDKRRAIMLNAARRKAQRTVSGVFCYVARG